MDKLVSLKIQISQYTYFFRQCPSSTYRNIVCPLVWITQKLLRTALYRMLWFHVNIWQIRFKWIRGMKKYVSSLVAFVYYSTRVLISICLLLTCCGVKFMVQTLTINHYLTRGGQMAWLIFSGLPNISISLHILLKLGCLWFLTKRVIFSPLFHI